jgi:hypothetical protein
MDKKREQLAVWRKEIKLDASIRGGILVVLSN